MGAVAFHTVNLRTHATKQHGEADFVVLWDGVLVVLEVKGGGVGKEDGHWYTTTRSGKKESLKEPPMDQARGAMYALRDVLKAEGAGYFEHEAVVITPDVAAPPASVEWEPTHWWDISQMSVAAMTQALEKVVAARPRKTFTMPQDKVRDLLFGSFSRLPAFDVGRGLVLEEQERATREQSQFLSTLAGNDRILTEGGAGTGKSLLLAEAARQEADQGRTALITFRSPALAGFFAPLLEGRGVTVNPISRIVPGRERYDVLLVDEAQDLMNDQDLAVLDQVLHGGLVSGRWRFSLDHNNQTHLGGAFSTDAYQRVKTSAPVLMRLSKNLRNTLAMVSFVQGYLGADVGNPGIVHGDQISWHPVEGPADADAAQHVAQQLVAQGADAEKVWIVSVSCDLPPRRTEQGFNLTSPRHAKGLETEHVVLCDLPEQFDSVAIASFYVAATRARLTLHILLTDADTPRLQDLVRKQVLSR